MTNDQASTDLASAELASAGAGERRRWLRDARRRRHGQHGAAHRPLRADHGARRAAAAAPRTGAPCSRCSPGTCRTARRYGVVAGTGRLLDALEQFRFGDAELEFLERASIADAPTLEFLRDYRFSGDIWGYAEGDCYFPGSPILVVEGTFAEAVILETLALSVFNHDCAIASAASRMVTAAHGRPLVEMGSRRTHERCGGRQRQGRVHRRLHDDLEPAGRLSVRRPDQRHERARVHAAARRRAPRVRSAARLARHRHDAARRHLRRARRDPGSGRASGSRARCDPDRQRRPGARWPARRARSSTRSARAKTRIVLTGDLDEFSIAALAAEPVDGYGVGTSLVTGSGAPTAALVYKLVARADADGPGPLRPVAKRSVGKPSRGGRKWATRRLDEAGSGGRRARHRQRADRRSRRPAAASAAGPRRRDRRAGADLGAARARHQQAVAELPGHARQLSRGYPAIPTIFEPDHD